MNNASHTLAFLLTARRRAGAALLAASMLAGCSAATDMMGVGAPRDLPESAAVDDAPWPRLADAPAPVSPLNRANPSADFALGGEIERDITAEAAQLRAEAAELRARPVIGGDLRREAAAVRQQNAALDARDAGAVSTTVGGGAQSDDGEAARIRAQLEQELRAEQDGARAVSTTVGEAEPAGAAAETEAEEAARIRAELEAELNAPREAAE